MLITLSSRRPVRTACTAADRAPELWGTAVRSQRGSWEGTAGEETAALIRFLAPFLLI
jgi:hypothetical protein